MAKQVLTLTDSDKLALGYWKQEDTALAKEIERIQRGRDQAESRLWACVAKSHGVELAEPLGQLSADASEAIVEVAE